MTDEQSLVYWKDRAEFLEKVIVELRGMIKDQQEDDTTRISQLEIALGQVYTIIAGLF
jgi:hypothetical protein